MISVVEEVRGNFEGINFFCAGDRGTYNYLNLNYQQLPELDLKLCHSTNTSFTSGMDSCGS
jgi:hypothetical protein